MNKWAEIYSEYRLKKMIENNKNKIQECQHELLHIDELYNPLCKDFNVREIQYKIKHLEDQIVEFNEALEYKKVN